MDNIGDYEIIQGQWDNEYCYYDLKTRGKENAVILWAALYEAEHADRNAFVAAQSLYNKVLKDGDDQLTWNQYVSCTVEPPCKEAAGVYSCMDCDSHKGESVKPMTPRQVRALLEEIGFDPGLDNSFTTLISF